jgi:hypothetical protein
MRGRKNKMSTATDFITKKRQAERDKRDAAFTTYRTVARKLAVAGKVTAAEEKQIETAIDALGFNLERVEADLATFRRENELEPVAAKLAEHRLAAAEVEAEGRVFAADHAEYMEGHTRSRDAIRSHAADKAREVAAAERAASDLADLRTQHHALLGTSDPTDLARKRCIVQAVFASIPGAGTVGEPVWALEELMRSPIDHWNLQSLAPEDLGVVEGQSSAEAKGLLQLALDLIGTPRQTRYLLRAADVAKVKTYPDVVTFADGLLDDPYLRFGPTGDDKKSPADFSYRFILAPGQPAEELEELKAVLRKRLARKPRPEVQVVQPEREPTVQPAFMRG